MPLNRGIEALDPPERRSLMHESDAVGCGGDQLGDSLDPQWLAVRTMRFLTLG
jgi:hypothetical protein